MLLGLAGSPPSIQITACSLPVSCYCFAWFGSIDPRIGYSAVTDFVLALLPWKVVWKLQMKRKERFGVAIAMSLGVL